MCREPVHVPFTFTGDSPKSIKTNGKTKDTENPLASSARQNDAGAPDTCGNRSLHRLSCDGRPAQSRHPVTEEGCSRVDPGTAGTPARRHTGQQGRPYTHRIQVFRISGTAGLPSGCGV